MSNTNFGGLDLKVASNTNFGFLNLKVAPKEDT